MDVRLACGALMTFKVKLANHNIRSHCCLLYIMSGDSQIRAHEDGSVRLFNPQLGTWDAFDGLLSETIIDGVDLFMNRLEGIFRSMDSSCKRTDEDVTDAVAKVLQDIGTDNNGARKYQVLVDRAIHEKGNKLLEDFKDAKKGRREPVPETMPDDTNPPAPAAMVYPWNIKIAQDLEKLIRRWQWRYSNAG